MRIYVQKKNLRSHIISHVRRTSIDFYPPLGLRVQEKSTKIIIKKKYGFIWKTKTVFEPFEYLTPYIYTYIFKTCEIIKAMNQIKTPEHKIFIIISIKQMVAWISLLNLALLLPKRTAFKTSYVPLLSHVTAICNLLHITNCISSTKNE